MQLAGEEGKGEGEEGGRQRPRTSHPGEGAGGRLTPAQPSPSCLPLPSSFSHAGHRTMPSLFPAFSCPGGHGHGMYTQDVPLFLFPFSSRLQRKNKIINLI